jgi:isopentenyl diphosphate isomerase/L-lactate dehydrogenase-like FMN-dependent dehydrogenase
MNPDDADKQIEANMRAIEKSRKVRKEIRETLRDSRQRTARALADLRRAGYLR